MLGNILTYLMYENMRTRIIFEQLTMHMLNYSNKFHICYAMLSKM